MNPPPAQHAPDPAAQPAQTVRAGVVQHPTPLDKQRAGLGGGFVGAVRARLWAALGRPLFRLLPPGMHRTRSALLRAFGARIGRRVSLEPTVRVEDPWRLTIGDDTEIAHEVILYCLADVVIGSGCRISQYAHLCAGTHDYTDPTMPLLTRPVRLEDEVWIAADVFVGPGVAIGTGSVVGARSSVFSDLGPWGIHAGNPTRRVRDRDAAEHAPREDAP